MSVSILEQMYFDQTNFSKKNTYWKGKYRFFFGWMIIGILTGAIPLIIFILLYTKQGFIYSKTTVSHSSPTLRWKKEGITVVGITGSPGRNKNQLNGPHDVVVDYANTLYIADSLNNRIQKYIRDASDGMTIAGQTDGTPNSSSSHLFYPIRVRCNQNGDLYIADTNNHRIQLWRNNNSSGITIAGNSFGLPGSGNNYLSNPYGITYDNLKTLYISDSGNNRLISYGFNASTGTILAGSSAALSNASLSVPYGLTYDTVSNSLLISNLFLHNILQIMLDNYQWKIIAGDSTGLSGDSSTKLNMPFDVTYDPMGNVYVADRGNSRIQLFMNGELNGITIAGMTGQSGSNASLFIAAVSIKLDNQLNLYVADYGNMRVQKFVRY